MGAGTQLIQMRETDGVSDRNLQDKAAPLPERSDLDICSIFSSTLRQTELDWSSLHGDVPVVREALHKVRRFLVVPRVLNINI